MIPQGQYNWKDRFTVRLSPVVLGRKNNGKPVASLEAWILAIVYRKLNSQTVFVQYPIPRIDDLLPDVKNNKLMLT